MGARWSDSEWPRSPRPGFEWHRLPLLAFIVAPWIVIALVVNLVLGWWPW